MLTKVMINQAERQGLLEDPGCRASSQSARESRGARISYQGIFDDEKNKDSMYDDIAGNEGR